MGPDTRKVTLIDDQVVLKKNKNCEYWEQAQKDVPEIRKLTGFETYCLGKY